MHPSSTGNGDLSPTVGNGVHSTIPGQAQINGGKASLTDGDTASASIKDEPSPQGTANGTPTTTNDAKKEESMKKEEIIDSGITVKMEPGEPLKLSRKASQKVAARPPPLFDDLPDATADATSEFEVMKDCHYANKGLGYTEPPLECDCAEAWDSATHTNNACDEHSDCINRATKMECVSDCACGSDCQNRRFQNKQYANVSVIKTDKKGYGLRADTDLQPHDFIFEYIGEVIGEAAFRRRMITYDEEGIKHFYFMSLTKGEFVDATRKGNLGRFCNHSCNPNCYVDKWVVGEKLRMGIFAERHIKAGEELVFNYNVDRYGADPQPCYCGEPNCVGFIGGKTQSGKTSKLSWKTVEALGLEDGEDWDNAVSKPMRKRKTGEDDSEYVSNVTPKTLEEDGVAKVMAELSLTKEKWIAVKLLSRIQRADDEKVCLRVVKLHGYRILNNVLKAFTEDDNIVLQACDILSRFPRLTRNKIHDSGIESTMSALKDSENETVQLQATTLLDTWSKLEMGFRIKKLKRDPNAILEEKKTERRESNRDRPDAESSETTKKISAPTGPRNNAPPRAPYRPPRPNWPLPKGWVEQRAPDGSIYYWNALGETTRRRPTQPVMTAPPPPGGAAPSKATSDKEILQNLINKIVAEKKPVDVAVADTTTPELKPKAQPTIREERWKSYSIEKRKKLYENTLFPPVAYVMNKYKKYFGKEDLKRLAKTIAKKMVESDFKHDRVKDPSAKLSHKQERAIKDHVKIYFDKAVVKHKESGRAARKAGTIDQTSKKPVSSQEVASADATIKGDTEPTAAVDDEVQLSENELEAEEVDHSMHDVSEMANEAGDDDFTALKRRREDETHQPGEDDNTESKRSRLDDDTPTSELLATMAIPPPPPPLLESPLDDNENGEPMDLEADDEPTVETKLEQLGTGDEHSTQVATPPTTGSTVDEKLDVMPNMS